MITVAVIGIISAIAVPAYRSYIETANMTKVTANFEEAVRLGRSTFTKDKTRIAIGLPATAPNDTGRGDKVTGAIGVKWKAAKTGSNPKPARLEL